MRRFLQTLAVALAVLGTAGGAWAGERHGGWGHGGGRGAWAREAHRGEGPHPWTRGERGPPPGWARRQAPPPGYYGPPPGMYEAPGYLRRGGYLPPNVRGEVVPDPGRYRLRPPPRGFNWVRVGNAFALMNMETGQLFDIIPD
ncbi:MAG: RcnB family protein [Alphaproteobacteria bacterium]|nr:RcnB family protein [Alphaproteobacteria bacterium]